MNQMHNDVGIPDWVLRLLPETDEPQLVNDDVVRKLEAFLSQNGRRIMTVPGPDGDAARRFNEIRQRIMILVKYNRDLRENAGPTEIMPPTTAEEADKQGYVECKVACDLLSFDSAPRLTEFLDQHHDSIRQFRPTARRRMVHAADLLKKLYKLRTEEEDARERALGEPKRRRTPIRKEEK